MSITATAAATHAPMDGAAILPEAEARSRTASGTENAPQVVFIDSGVPDLSQLVAGARPGLQVFVLDDGREGLPQIADLLKANALHDLAAIHIVSHGGPGQLQLGSTPVDAGSIARHGKLLAEIGAALSPDGDILLYGCDVARGATGRQFITELSVYTGADVAAATHKVGAAEQGASWKLDVGTGPIAAGMAFTPQAMADYRGVLATPDAVDDGPVAVNEDATTTNLAALVVSNDTDADGGDVLRIVSATQGAKGSVVFNNGGTPAVPGDDTLTYTADGAVLDALAVGQSTTDTFTYTLSDGTTTDTATVTMTINGVNDNPDAVDDGPVAVNEDAATANLTPTLLGNDTDPDSGETATLRITAVTQGAKGSVVFNAGTAAPGDETVTYTADGAVLDALAVGQSTTDTFTYTIEDAQGVTDTATVTMTINGVNDNPDAVDDGPVAVNEDAATANLTPTLLGNDTDPDSGETATLRITAVTQGAKGSVVFNAGTAAPGDETVTYTADGAVLDALAVGQSTTDTFTYTIEDAQGVTDTATVTMTINGVNDNPDAVDDGPVAVNEDAATANLTPTLLGNDTDPDSGETATLRITAVTQGAKGSVVFNAGTAAPGDETVTYTADGAVLDALAVGQSTTDTFTYTIEDAQGVTDTATVTMTINGVNDNPDAVDDGPVAVNEDAATANLTPTLLGNDTDPDSGETATLRITAVTQGAKGSVVFNAGTAAPGDETVTYTADGAVLDALAVGQSTTDTFTYTIEDAQGVTDTATVTMTINGVNDNPDAVDDGPVAVNEDAATANLTPTLLGNDTDPDSGETATLRITAVTQGAKGSVVFNAGTAAPGDETVTYTADGAVLDALAVGQSTTDTFTYTIEDAQGVTDTATVTMTINGVNDNPDAVDDGPVAVNEDAATANLTPTLLGNDTDPDSGETATLRITAVTQGAKGSVVFNAGTAAPGDETVTYTADGAVLDALAVGQSTTDTFTYTIEDAQGVTDTATVNVTINGVNDAPILSAAATPVLATENEDAGAPVGAVGTLVSSLIDLPGGGGLNNVSDIDSGAVTGIAITNVNNANGTWHYSINNGANWTAIGSPTDLAARLLAADANTRVYFQPNANFNGTVTAGITFRAWDTTSGTNGGTADTTSNGTSTAFSIATDTADISITAVNDAPVNTVPGAQIIAEDTATTITGISVLDVDAAPQTVQMTLHVDNGILDVRTDVGGGLAAWQVSGDTTGTVVLTGTTAQINASLGAANGLRYQGNLNFSGADTLTVTTNDLGHNGVDPGNTGTATSEQDLDTVGITVNAAAAANTLSAFQTTVLYNNPATVGVDGDLDGDGQIDPLDTVLVTVQIANNSATTAATGVTFENITGALNGMTDTGAINVSPIAFDDAYNAVANATLVVSAANGVLFNDREPGGTNGINIDGTTQVVAGTFATANGSVTFQTDGSFTWTASTVDFSGSDTFTYTVRDAGLNGVFGDADDLTDTGSGTVTTTGTAWFIDNNAVGSTNVGTQANPFTSIAAFNLANVGGAGNPDDNDTVYLREGTGTYAEAGINLRNGQVLIGQGENLVVNGITVANEVGNAVDTPTISVTGAGEHGIDLGAGNNIRGLNIVTNAASQVGIDDGGAGGGTVGTLTITNVDVTGVGQAVDIDEGGALSVFIDNLTSTGSGTQGVQLAANGAALTGTFAVTTGAISGSTGTAFQIGLGDAGAAGVGGTATVSFGGTVASTGAARAVEIQDRAASAGNVTVSGNVSHTGGNATTIYLDDNVAGNVTFGGTANIASSGTANAIHIQDQAAGTVTFSGSVKVDTTTGTGVNLVGNGSIVNFAGGGLDIDTTTGIGFNATGLGGNVISVSGSGNSITTTTGTAINLDGVAVGNGGSTLGITFATVNSSGAANGILIGTVGQQANSSGINIQGGALSGVTSRGVDINDTSANISIGATISTNGTDASPGTGRSVEVTNSGSNVVGGSLITFSAAINENGTGIALDNNDQNTNGATILFSGGLDIDTSTSVGFSATNGGTVRVTGTSNSITSVSATALNVANTTIGTGGLNFHDISAGNNTAAADPVNGIVLNNTGSTAGLTVAGTPGTANSGGTIQNTTGDAISLNNTRNVSLTEMQVLSGGDNNIDANTVTNLTLNSFNSDTSANTAVLGTSITGLTISNGSAFNHSGNGAGEHGVFITGLFGTSSVTSTTFQDSAETQFKISNSTASTAQGSAATDILTMSAVTFSNLTDPTFGDNIQINSDVTANMHFILNGTTGANSIDGGITGVLVNASSGGDIDVDISGTTVTGGTGVGINFNPVGAGTKLWFDVNNNIISNRGSTGLNATSINNSVIEGIFTSNTITQGTNGNGINIIAEGQGAAGTANVTISAVNNTITGSQNGGGINAQARVGGIVNLTLDNNHVNINHALNLEGIRVTSGSSGAGDNSNVVRLNMLNNDVTVGALSGQEDYALQVRAGNTFQLQNFVGNGDATNTTDELNWVITTKDNNKFDGVTNPVVQIQHTSGGVFSASAGNIPTPVLPLAAAPGGVQAAPDPTGGASGSAGNTPVAPGETAPVAGTANAPTSGLSGMVTYQLAQAQLDAMVAAAIARWEATGLTAEQIAILRGTEVGVQDMSSMSLGFARHGHINLDLDAAGYGWYVDLNPGDDSEFGNVLSASRLEADPSQLPAGHIDLLTALMHEMGHQLGFGDSYVGDNRDDLMFGYLVSGERRLPTDHLADGVLPGTAGFADLLVGPVSIGTLPAGTTVTIQYTATINAQNNQLIVNPSNQGTPIQATNPPADFPDTSTNVSVTSLDSLSLGDIIFNDADGDGLYEPLSGETGISGVALTLFADINNSGGLDAGDTQLATTISALDGSYSFFGLAPGNYIVGIDTTNFNLGGALVAFPNSSSGNPDPDNNTDNDDNGGPIGGVAGTSFASLAITLAYNTEPTTDGDADADTNNTLDFGFFNIPPNDPPDVVVTGAAAADFEEDGPPVDLEPTLTLDDDDDNPPDVDPTNDNIEGATVTITDFVAGDELLFTLQGGITGGYAAGVLSLSGSASEADYQAVLRSVQYRSISDNPDDFGLDTVRNIEWTVNDGTQDSVAQTTTVNVFGVNDAPTLIDGTPVLTAVNEDAVNPPIGTVGTPISSLVNINPPLGGLDNVTDPDSTDTGIALVATAGSGTWFYTTNNGANWTAVGTVSGTAALLLAADGGNSTRLYFSPAADFNGIVSPAITFRAWDQTFGTNGQSGVDLTTLLPAAATAFSTATDTANITVNAVADIVNDTLAATEDTAVTANVITGTNGASADNFENGGRTLTAVTQGAHGSVTFDSTGSVTYTPDEDFNGADTFDYTVTSGGVTETGTVTVNVAAADDATDDTLATTEDTAVTANVLTGTNGATADNFEDVTRTLTAVTQGAHGSVTFAANGSVTYTPDADFNGSDTFDYTVTAGGVTETATVTVNVGAAADIVADTPTVAEDSIASTIDVLANDGFEDSSRELTSFTAALHGTVTRDTNGTASLTDDKLFYTPNADYNGSDTFNYTVTAGGVTESTTVTVNITAVADIVADSPTVNEDSGANTIDVLANDTFEDPTRELTSFTQGANGTVARDTNGTATLADDKLIYTPVANFSGPDTFQYTVTSAGLTETTTVSVNVAPVNDPPAGADNTVTASEDVAYVFTAADFGFSDPLDIPPNSLAAVRIATLPGAGTLTNNDVAVSAGDVIGVGDITGGLLKFVPAADANGNGYASFTFQVQDNGGAPDLDLSANTLTVNVMAVADIQNDNVSVGEDSGVNTLNLLANDSFEDATRAITAVGPAANGTTAINNNGTVGNTADDFVTYTPNANYFGPDSFTYTVTSNGTTEQATVNVTVTGVNDTPVNTVPGAQAVGEDTNLAIAGLQVNDIDAGAGTLTTTLSVASGALTVASAGGAAVGGSGTNVVTLTGTVAQINTTLAAAGNVIYRGNLNFEGADTLTMTTNDGGNTGSDPGLTGNGTSEQDVDTVAIDITEVNDAPVAADDTLSTVAEDSGTRTILFADLTGNDNKGAANESGQTLTVLSVNNGTAVGGTVAIVAGHVEFTPTANFFGTASFEYTVQDNGTTNGVGDPKTDIGLASFQVTGVNDAPVNTVPGAQAVGEDTNLAIAGLQVNDIDAGAGTLTTTLSVASGALTVASAGGAAVGGSGTNVVTLTGTVAQINTTLTAAGNVIYRGNLNFEGADTLTMTTNDGGNTGSDPGLTGNGTSEQDVDTVAIDITEVNDAPVAADDTLSTVAEDSGTRTILFADLTGNDNKGAANESGQTLTVLSVNNGTAVGGTVAIVAGHVEFTPTANFFGTASFEYTVQDNGTTNGVGDPKTDIGLASFQVTGVNDAPALANVDTNAAYTENAAPVALDAVPLIVPSDIDTATLSSATIAITGGFVPGDILDWPNFPIPASLSASYDASTGVLTISAVDTLADYQEVLRGITFRSTSDNPTNFGANPTRTITWTITDSGSPNLSSVSQTTTIAITPVNDAPSLDNVASAVTLPPVGGAVTLSPGLTVSDADNQNLASATVRITGGVFPGDGNLLAANTAGTGITAIYDAGTETLTLSGADTLAHYQQVLATVTFDTTSTNPTNSGLNPTRTIEWQLNDGSGIANLSSIDTTTVGLSRPPANDFNADGTSDVLLRYFNGFTSEWEMHAGQIVDSLGIGMPSLEFKFQDTGDFNGDGRTDVLWRHDNGQVVLWEMDGNDITLNQEVFTVDNLWQIQGAADFNGDGNSDILWRHADGQVNLWEMDGPNIVSNQFVGTPGNDWHVQGLVDTGGDGKSDVILRHNSGQVVVWTMDGAQIVDNQSIANVGLDWNIAGTGDFNGDGKGDILWRNDSGQVSLWQMDGATLLSVDSVGAPSNEWKIQDVGDYNADGRSDVLLRHNSGQVAMWEMDGAQITSNHEVLPQVGNEWTILNHQYLIL